MQRKITFAVNSSSPTVSGERISFRDDKVNDVRFSFGTDVGSSIRCPRYAWDTASWPTLPNRHTPGSYVCDFTAGIPNFSRISPQSPVPTPTALRQ